MGDGSYIAQLKELVSEKNIKNVLFHGRRPYEEMNDILAQSDILVLPLMSDQGIMKTEPLKLQSYLYAGKPIFGVLGGSGQEIIEENNLGVCASPSEVDEIALGFYRSIDFARKHSEVVKDSAKRLMDTRFNKDVIIKTFTDTLRGMVQDRAE